MVDDQEQVNTTLYKELILGEAPEKLGVGYSDLEKESMIFLLSVIFIWYYSMRSSSFF